MVVQLRPNSSKQLFIIKLNNEGVMIEATYTL